ncbi:hypothetical protein AC579_6962 [Pseudocercospora musae]|uniref:Uncharacterized protein n=1 Tax=Pseudocercospora musae TaxID=113226 RepID=A0A139ING9_9PEZI|nr:hypothetical protein AC579_6962 [Pseudocercospora musae]
MPRKRVWVRLAKRTKKSAWIKKLTERWASLHSELLIEGREEPCYFLEKLPPELRNRIYEYLLVRRKRIQISKHLRPRALLHTCSQMRGETTKMCRENFTPSLCTLLTLHTTTSKRLKAFH